MKTKRCRNIGDKDTFSFLDLMMGFAWIEVSFAAFVLIIEEGWYSVTPEIIAQHIAERCRCDVIVDAFCGVGGNSIQFAQYCKKVIAVDIQPEKIKLARHNARIYGVDHKIEFLTGDFLELAPTIKADGVFLSPPWGGPEYNSRKVFDIQKMTPNGYDIFEAASKISSHIAYYLPRMSEHKQLAELAGPGNEVEIEQNFMGKYVKALTAYYGGFIFHPKRKSKKEQTDQIED
eukprot:TRINITY_DN5737_c0_g1_i2.p1 TRINITY_DN5737_c0_g1~~TRINITY_DN5737_c0_g1_i2.p1  ORF type:complete len:232 (-),score=50.83 TRINITY_DN5737_c0_g1_i2:52-747(-)